MSIPGKPFQPLLATADSASSIAERTTKAMADYRRLQDARIRASTELERLQAELDTLESSAMAEWGTSNPSELEAIAARMQAEDLEDVDRFEKALERARALYAAAEAAPLP